MLSRIAQHLGGRELNHAFDLGCGVGDWTLSYLGFARRATGVDVNEAFLGAAQRRAAALGLEGRLRFDVGTLEDFPTHDDVDFVGLGACLMYVSNVGVNRLLQRVAGMLRPGGLVYVRSTVVTPLRRRHETRLGIYRYKEEYETLFRSNGLSVLDCAFSTGVVVEHVAARLEHPGTRALAARSLTAMGRLGRATKNLTEHCNWLLCRSPELETP